MGQSGAGKSSLIKCCSGGTAYPGSNLRSVPQYCTNEAQRYTRCAAIWESYFRILSLENKTVAENIAFAMKVVGSSSRDIRQRVPEVIKMVGLSGKENLTHPIIRWRTEGGYCPSSGQLSLSC